jgi:hypothetical protein
MSTAVENLRLRQVLYQGFVLPATAATEAREARRAMRRFVQCSIADSPGFGDDGSARIYPFWGMFK